MLRVDPPADSAFDFDPFAGPRLALTAPTTESQREIWAATQMGADASCAFNESNAVRLLGLLDIDALGHALEAVVQRHEALRTTISPDGVSLLVAAERPLELGLEDLSSLETAARDARLAEIRRAEVETPFDLEFGPLLRVRLVCLKRDEHVLFMTAHHIICDGWSTGVLLHDLGAFYSAPRRGQTDAGLPQATPFSAYALDELARAGGAEDGADERYWVGQFTGELPILELPTDAARPPLRTYNSARIDHTLDAELVASLKAAAKSCGASFFSLILTGFDVLLHRLTGQDDLVVGIATAGQLGTGMTDLVGHCVNTLPIRTRVDSQASFKSLLGQVRGTMLDATEHQLYTFGRLLQQLPLTRDPARAPLVSVLFNLDSGIADESLGFDGLEARFTSNARHYENFELFVNTVEQHGRLRIECQYNTDLFKAETVARWLESFEVLLRSVGGDVDQAIATVQVHTPTELALVAQVNDTRADYPADSCTYQLVEQQCRVTPDAVAVDFEGASMTYAELDRRSNQLARHLRALGVGPEVLVGLALRRTLNLPVAMLAIHKAGGAYVPIDPAYPAERIGFMLSDSRLPLLVTESALVGTVPPHDAQILCLDEERDAAAIGAESDAALEPLAKPDNLAYVIYTSGSTGKPKGVQLPHIALVNFLTSMAREPGLTRTDVLVAVTSLSFDIAGLELWLPLIVGARIVLASRETAGDGVLLRATVEAHNATALQATPSTWRLLIGAGWQGGRHFKIMCGGEALPHDLAVDLIARSGSAWNLYGPTETTIWSTCQRLEPGVERVLIGRPIANTTVYVLDNRRGHVPLGAIGELYIGGDGLARGYLNRPDLTDERFVADPFGPAGQRLYRTGDLVRLRADGELEYLGRNDFQVKVRGHRIELGEIEALLAQHPAVTQAVALAREDRPGDVRLVGYVLRSGAAAVEEAELREWARGSLPDYMVPQHIIGLDAFPLTPNGKIDRRALPAPLLDFNAGAYEAPRSDAEQLLAQLWQEALGVGRIGRHDDFFALGGHSLLAAQVMARLAREHGLALPIRRVFEAPTIAKFAPFLTGTHRVVHIPRRTGVGPASASIMQRRVTLLEQIDSGRRTFNLPAAWRLRGDIDTAALRLALNAFVERHEATRTTLRWYGEDVVQTVAPRLEFDLDVQDLRDVPAPERESVLMAALLAASDEPFVLGSGPLIRAQLFRLAHDEHVLFVLVHHAIWDGWSFDIFVREIDSLYGAYRRNETPALAELPIQYSDFAEWHNEWLSGPELTEQVAYWHEQLTGELPPLELPIDRSRPKVLSDAGATEWVEVSRAEADALTALARREGVTLFGVLLAAYQTLLHRYSGQPEFLVGMPVRGRSQPEVEDLVGWFVNTIVLRADFTVEPTFREVLQRVRATVLDAFSHQDVPFEQLQMSRNPAYRAFFSFQDSRNRPSAIGDLRLSQIHVLPEAAANDVSLWIMENETGLMGGLNYSTDLFDRATMQRFLASFRMLLRSIVEDAEQPVSLLRIVSEAEPTTTALDSPADREAQPLHVSFEAQVDRNPSAVAVIAEDGSLNYAQLDAQANALAQNLRAAGVGPSVPVALCATGLQRAIGLIAISKAGGAAVPIDAEHPEAWVARIIDHCRLTVAVADSDGQHLFAERGITVISFDGRENSQRSSTQARTVDPALRAYTVGLDGAPFGVELTHAALSLILSDVAAHVGLDDRSRMMAAGPAGSGRSFMEGWLPLIAGAALVIAEPRVRSDGELMRDLLVRSGATALHADPHSWSVLLEADWQAPAEFVGVVSGEALRVELAAELTSRVGRAFSLYGQAESGFWSGLVNLNATTDSPSSFAPLGRPIGGSYWRVVDRHLQPVPLGVMGELVVGFSTPENRLVRTGDRVRLRPNGSLEYLGRTDDRLTLNGQRIEPAAIEPLLEQHPAIERAAVAVRVEAGQRRLVAWIVTRPEEDYTDSELRRALRKLLPDAMVPRRFVELDALPTSANGSIDRSRLPSSDGTGTEAAGAEPRTDAERLVAGIWQEALRIDQVHVHDNFFDLGGHSLLCLQVITRIENRSGMRLSPRVLLLNSLEQVAAQIPSAVPAAVN